MSESVQADIAPPEYPPGSNLGPQTPTSIRMVAEYILFDVTKLNSRREGYIGVSATFTMSNQSDSDENMLVRFPLGCGDSDFPRIRNLQVTLGAIPVTVTYQSDDPIILPLPPLYRGPQIPCELMPWATFTTTFPAQQATIVNVHYELLPTTISSSAGAFGYILETGAGWHESIGQAAFVVRLPYPAHADNVSGWWESSQPFVPHYEQNDAIWTVENLEPTAKHNLIFRIIYPQIWQEVVTALSILDKTPEDIEALIQLGNAYHGAAWEFHGDTNPHYLDLSIQAYNQALSLNPHSAKAHIGIASALWNKQGIVFYPLDPEATFLPPILEHLSFALALEPENNQGRQLWVEIDDVSNHQVALPTVNPTLLPSPTATPTRTATYTSKPPSSPTPTVEPTAMATSTRIFTTTPVPTLSPQLSSTSALSNTTSPENEPAADTLWLALMVAIKVCFSVLFVAIKRRKA